MPKAPANQPDGLVARDFACRLTGFFYDMVISFAMTKSSFPCRTFSFFLIQINKMPGYSASMVRVA
jgi:hypothetical protein